MSDQKMRELRDKLVSDINRPDGRWGIHGHSSVDDDYFLALEYVVDRIDEALAQPAEAVELTDDYIAKLLKTRMPGGAEALVWFSHYDSPRVLPVIKDVVRKIIEAHEAKRSQQ